MIFQSIYRVTALPWSHAILLYRLRRTITVLMYHGVIEDDSKFHSWNLVPASKFDEHLRYLKAHFSVISIEEALSLHERCTDTRPKAVVTFDDGMRNNLMVALPILQQHGVPATIYISTEAVQSGQAFWWDRIAQATQTSESTRFDLSSFSLGTYAFESGMEKHLWWRAMSRLLEDLKDLPHIVRKDAVGIMLKQLGEEDTQIDKAFTPLTVADVKTLSSSSLISIGSHTHCHSILTQLTPKEARHSIERSLSLLTDWTQRPIHHFSFPNGNYNKTVLEILNKLKIRSAVTTEDREWEPRSSPLCIPRIGISGYDRIEVFMGKVLRLRRLFRSIKTRTIGDK